jgi:dipeptidyl aminopeptidase/acylaminoacyl peptidase
MRIAILVAATIALATPIAALAQAAPQPSGPPPLAAYGDLPAIEFMRLSPSGSRFAFVAVSGEERRLFVRDVSGGDALIASKVGDTKVLDIAWAGDDFVLVSLSQTVKGPTLTRWPVKEDRFEIESVTCINLKTGKASMIFEKAPKMRNLFLKMVVGQYGYRQIDGRWYGYFSSITEGSGDVDLYRVDLETGEGELAARGGTLGRNWVVDLDGSIAASIEYIGVTKETHVMAGDGGKVVLSRADPFDGIGLLGVGRARGTVLISDQTGEKDQTEELSISQPGSMTPLVGDEVIDQEIRDPIGHQLLGFITDHERAIWFDPKIEARYNSAKKAFPGYHFHLRSWSQGFDKVIAFTDGADDAGTYWLVDLTTGKASELIEAYPAIKGPQVGPTQMIDYKAADSLSLQGVLTLPPGKQAQKLPLVVMPHGGPLGTRDEVGFDWWAQAFASRGYAVFQPNFRGSDGYGAKFRNAANGEYGRKMLSDISDGVAALAANGVIDRARVCIVGASYGGYAAEAGVTIQHGIYRCAVAVAGVASPGEFLFRAGDVSGVTWDPDIRALRRVMGADYASDDALRAISPMFHAKDADAPVLLIHGQDDTVVKPKQSQEFADRLRDAGAEHELLLVPSLDHHLSTGKTRQIVLDASVAFVLKQNPPN